MNAIDFITAKALLGQAGPIPQVKYDEYADGRIKFIGIGERGAADTASVWEIFYLTWTTMNPAWIRTAPENSKWSDRETILSNGNFK